MELRGIEAAVSQEYRWSRIVVSVLVKVCVGVGLAAAITTLIALFGTASTGTAIAVLFGAAAKTAILYWIGSSVGLGVVAGGVILSVLAVVAGVVAAFFILRALFGRRTRDGSSVVKVLAACQLMAKAIATELKKGVLPDRDQRKTLASEGLKPLLELLDKPADSSERTIEELLGTVPRRKFRIHHQSLKELTAALEDGCRE